jgi:DNA-binding LacI/PurR family transcriptional regulator
MTLEESRALQRLADVPRGIAKTLMLAYGFTDELIASLVLNGLATVAPDIARIGKQTIEIELVMITGAGRKAVWNRMPLGRRFEVDRT